MSAARYPGELIGHGRTPRDPQWPGRGRVAVQLVVNCEEGDECSILHGDPYSEAFLSDVLGAVPRSGQRHMNVESVVTFADQTPVVT